MKIEMNFEMKQRLGNSEMVNYLNQVRLDPLLQPRADSKIVHINECFFFEDCLSPDFDFERALAQHVDRTALEHSMSEVYIPFAPVQEDWSAQAIFAQGYKFAMHLALRLQAIGQFQVIFSFRYEESTESPVVFAEPHDLYIYSSSQINFHLVRPNEQLLADDIEGYQQEALLVIDTIGT